MKLALVVFVAFAVLFVIAKTEGKRAAYQSFRIYA